MQQRTPRSTPRQLVAFKQAINKIRLPYELAQKSQNNISGLIFDNSTILEAYSATCDITKLLASAQLREHLKLNSSILLQHWKAIQFWFIWFISHYNVSEDDHNDIPFEHRERSPVASVCNALCSIRSIDDSNPSLIGGEFRHSIVSNIALFDGVAKAWVEQDSQIYMGKDQDELQAWATRFSPHPSRCLIDFFMYTSLDPNSRLRTRLLKLAGGDMDLVASSAIQRLRALLQLRKHSVLVFEDIVTYMTLLTNLFHPHETILGKSLVRNRVVSVQAKAVRRCLEIYYALSGTSSITKTQLCEPAGVAVSIVPFALEVERTPAIVRQAVKHRLIESYIQLFAKLRVQQINTLDRRYELFAGTVTDFIHTYSVLDAVILSFKRLTPSQVRELQSMPHLQRLWNATIERAIVKALFDKTWISAKIRCTWCNGDQVSLGICDGCRVPRYCSSDCQKQDWLHGHREACLQSHGAELRYRKAITKAQAFAMHLAISDTRHCCPGLLKQAELDFPGIPISDLAVSVSYSPSPPDGHGIHGPVFRISKPAKTQPRQISILGDENVVHVVADIVIQKEKTYIPVDVPITTGDSTSRALSDFRPDRMKKRLSGRDGFLETLEWDSVDSIWEIATKMGGSVWDNILRITDA